MFTMTFGSESIELRNPDFGNRHSVEVRRIQRRSRGGDLIIYRDDDWPKTSVLEYRFSALKQDKVTELLYFLRISLGQIISYTDHEGFVRSGIIVEPTAPTSEEGRSDFQATIKIQVQE